MSVAILTGLIRVKALTTITPADYGHKVEYVEYITQLQRTVQSDWIKGDLTDFCTGRCYLTKDWYYVKLNQSLNPGITYTWNFNTWITNRDNQNYYNKSNFYMIASNTGKYEGSSSANVTNLTCRAGIEEGSTSKVSWSCSFTPTTPINYLYLRITFYEDTDKQFTSYGCNKGSLLNDNALDLVMLAGTDNTKVTFACATSAKYDAGMMVKEAAKLTGGNGGGKKNLAQAGGKDASKISEALDHIKGLL